MEAMGQRGLPIWGMRHFLHLTNGGVVGLTKKVMNGTAGAAPGLLAERQVGMQHRAAGLGRTGARSQVAADGVGQQQRKAAITRAYWGQVGGHLHRLGSHHDRGPG
mmetsp:Transcript_2854/g.6680  ORF Transcript_2854/g.6680 Transcript_2854/m.6680 type:complete len:106 (-) Transcript_2854:967-1284(-)